MRKPIISIKLSPVDYAGLINLGNRVIVSLTGNANFATPLVTLVILQAAVTAAEDAYAVWAPLGSRGSHASLLDLQEKMLTLHGLLIAESHYVQAIAQTAAGSDYAAQAAIIGTSGYELKSAPSPQGPLEMVQNLHRFVSRTLTVNQLKLKWKRPLNAAPGTVLDYRIMRGTTTDFAAAAEIASTSRTSFIDVNDGNAPQTRTYWVVGFNSAGLGVPSDPITVTVLNA